MSSTSEFEPAAVGEWDVVVIGGGAAGMMAAFRAAERGLRTLLLEKNRRPGIKILMSGGTRCNITHDCDNRGIVSAYGKAQGPFLHSALAGFGVREVVEFFESEGLATKIEETGKVFPVSNKAADVLDVLVRRVHRSGAILRCDTAVSGLHRVGDGFVVETANGPIRAPKVILTSGGMSYPGCGTKGDGYPWVTAFGHTMVPPRPALVPLKIAAAWVAALKGITLDDTNLSIFDGEKNLLSRRGGFLFAHFGLTGPAPLDVSKAVSRHETPSSLSLEIDFLPGRAEAWFEEHLKNESLNSGKKHLAVILSELLPRRLCDEMLTLTGQPADRRAAGLSKDDRRKLVTAFKRNRTPVSGTLGFEKAEVTSGGVSLDEVDSRTMQSKRVPGLYLAGEILDLDGPIGGYNFQAAWSTGTLAGRSV